jgi:hypothetical protein
LNNLENKPNEWQLCSLMLYLKMNKYFFVVLVAIAPLFALKAQPGGRGFQGTPEEMAQRQTDMMVEKLSLSEAQASRIQEINLKYALKMKAARDSMPEGDWQMMRQKMTGLRQEQDAALRKMMTSEQWAIYEQWKEEQRAKREAQRNQGN